MNRYRRWKNKRAVLRWVNEVRVALCGVPLHRLPSGKLSSAMSCPIANSVKTAPCVGLVSTTTYDTVTSQREFEHPPHVQQFVRDFDDGLYPELIA